MVVGFFGALPPPLFGPLGGCDPIYVRDAASPATARVLLDGVPTCSHVSLSPFGTLPRRTGACPACSGVLALGAVCPPVVRLSGRQQLGKGDGHEPFASWVERQASSPWDKAKIPIAKVFFDVVPLELGSMVVVFSGALPPPLFGRWGEV